VKFARCPPVRREDVPEHQGRALRGDASRRRTRELVSERRAFEILTDRAEHGIPVEPLPDPRG
jgi:hypothetical protein